MRPPGRVGVRQSGPFVPNRGSHVGVTGDETIRNHAAFIWSVADLVRGDYKQSASGRVILPMVVLR